MARTLAKKTRKTGKLKKLAKSRKAMRISKKTTRRRNKAMRRRKKTTRRRKKGGRGVLENVKDRLGDAQELYQREKRARQQKRLDIQKQKLELKAAGLSDRGIDSVVRRRYREFKLNKIHDDYTRAEEIADDSKKILDKLNKIYDKEEDKDDNRVISNYFSSEEEFSRRTTNINGNGENVRRWWKCGDVNDTNSIDCKGAEDGKYLPEIDMTQLKKLKIAVISVLKDYLDQATKKADIDTILKKITEKLSLLVQYHKVRDRGELVKFIINNNSKGTAKTDKQHKASKTDEQHEAFIDAVVKAFNTAPTGAPTADSASDDDEEVEGIPPAAVASVEKAHAAEEQEQEAAADADEEQEQEKEQEKEQEEEEEATEVKDAEVTEEEEERDRAEGEGEEKDTKDIAPEEATEEASKYTMINADIDQTKISDLIKQIQGPDPVTIEVSHINFNSFIRAKPIMWMSMLNKMMEDPLAGPKTISKLFELAREQNIDLVKLTNSASTKLWTGKGKWAKLIKKYLAEGKMAEALNDAQSRHPQMEDEGEEDWNLRVNKWLVAEAKALKNGKPAEHAELYFTGKVFFPDVVNSDFLKFERLNEQGKQLASKASEDLKKLLKESQENEVAIIKKFIKNNRDAWLILIKNLDWQEKIKGFDQAEQEEIHTQTVIKYKDFITQKIYKEENKNNNKTPSTPAEARAKRLGAKGIRSSPDDDKISQKQIREKRPPFTRRIRWPWSK